MPEHLAHSKKQGPKISGMFRLALFFAFNPDESLLTSDVALKIDVNKDKVPDYLYHAVVAGLFTRRKVGPGGIRARIEWTAGPKLLELVGEFKQLEKP